MSISAGIKLARLALGARPLDPSIKGANETYFGAIDTDSGSVLAYVKDLDETQLSNEITAALVALGADLPIPQPYLVAVTSDVLPFNKAPVLSDGETALFFGSASSEGIPIRQLIARADLVPATELKKWKYYRSAATFDEWVANGDRHAGNLLYDGDGKYLLIDHSHAFTGPNWGIDGLRPDVDVSNKLIQGWVSSYLSDADREAFADQVDAIEASFGRIFLSEVLSVPLDLPNSLPERNRAVTRFLEARRPTLAISIRRKLGKERML